MDEQLRTMLWNVVYLMCLAKFDDYYGPNNEERSLIKCLWFSYINEPINNMPNDEQIVHDFQVRFFRWDWFEVYDFLGAILDCLPDDNSRAEFADTCNSVLEEQLSAYRIVNGVAIEITSEHEIAAIEEAIENSPTSTQVHLKQALQHFSNREQPDYRNSIKESINAVEAICKQIAKSPKSTLGEALRKIETEGNLQIHPAFKAGMSNIYGWTSDGDGIRHALTEQSNVAAEDAKYMLVSCSAFINYLIVKADKAGIKL